MTRDQELLDLIRQRKATGEFNYGILPADLYVKTMEQSCGLDLCYKYASQGSTSYADALVKASRKLTYNNPDMVIQDIYTDFKAKTADLNLGDFELPKNTLQVFRHVYSTPRKDRDGDIMRSEGGKLDPKMLMLWQHVHTLPIGKLITVYNQNKKGIEVISAIVDMNDLSHDAAVMIENKMGRFSHGFRALEFQKIKSVEQMDELEELLGVKFSDEERTKAKEGKASGFDITEWEGMEESLVSVPANVDAETQEIYLSLIEGKQLRSRLMKSYGEHLREGRATMIPVNLDLKVTLNGRSLEDGQFNVSEKGTGEGCSCGNGTGASKQEEHDADGTKEPESDTEDTKMICPECGSKIVDGVCKECGYRMKEKDEEKNATPDGEKVGRVLSKNNYQKLVDIKEDMNEIHEMHVATRSGKAMCKGCMMKLDDVIKSAGMDEEDKQTELTVKEAMSFIFKNATKDERQRLAASLKTFEVLEKRAKRRNELKAYLGSSQS